MRGVFFSNFPSRTRDDELRSRLIFVNRKPRRSPEFSSGLRFSAREKDTREQFTCDKVRSGSRRSTVADSSSELAEPRGIPRGMRRDFGRNRGEFHARDYPRLFSPNVINYFLRVALNVRTSGAFLYEISSDVRRRARNWIVVRWSSSCVKRHRVEIKFSTRIRPAIYCISAAACVYGLIKTKKMSRRS